jgi:polyisoprenoid-binding protein YceI
MRRYRIQPEVSQVWIEGSSSVHSIRASATGLTGWVEIAEPDAPVATLAGEIRIAVDRLGSGNPLVDRETRRRIDARRHPEIVGTVEVAAPVEPDRFAVTGSITFRGVSCRVSGELAVSREGDHVIVTGAETLDVRRWELRLPRLGLLRVHPDVLVRVRVSAAASDDREPTGA